MPDVNGVLVDERYSPVVLENLRTKTFLMPNVTYNPKYMGGSVDAGVVNFYKFNPTSTGAVAVGGDYSATEPSNELVKVYISNAFRQQKKLRKVTEEMITPSLSKNVMTNLSEDIREGRDLTAIAALKHNSTPAASPVALTKANVLEKVDAAIDLQKSNKCRPDVLLVSTKVLTLIRQNNLSNSVFTPETNEEMFKNGVVGRYNGCMVIERTELANPTSNAVKYYPTDTVVTVDLSKTDFIVYNSEWFAVVSELTDSRIQPVPDFAGSMAMAEVNAGMKLLNEKCGVSYTRA